jgi:membrane protease YdiL (CAAX protease family)
VTSLGATAAWLAALGGLPLLLWLLRRSGVDTLRWPARLSLWLVGAAVLAALLASGVALPPFASRVAPGFTVAATVLAVVATLAGFALLQRLAPARGRAAEAQQQAYAALAARTPAERAFTVVTAGVVEEWLYRGVGIGVGSTLVGAPLAVVASLAAFTLGHARWGKAHLLPVAWAGAVLSLLFLATGSLIACIIAHLAVDAVGVLLLPLAQRRRGLSAPNRETR